jgi:hypothetical protein
VEENDIGQSMGELKRGYQAILCHTVCMTDEDHAWMKYARRKLNEIRLAEVPEIKQIDLLHVFHKIVFKTYHWLKVLLLQLSALNKTFFYIFVVLCRNMTLRLLTVEYFFL